jgi:DNA-binding winged helix-turn-helix (wHTH) protein
MSLAPRAGWARIRGSAGPTSRMELQNSPPRFYDFGPFRVDTARRLLLRGQHPVYLTARVFDLLHFLLCQRDRAVSRAELFQVLWPDVVVEDGNLSVNVSVLRKALQDDVGSCYIETLPRVGYRFCGEVLEHSGERAGLGAERAPAGRVASARPRPSPPRAGRSAQSAALNQTPCLGTNLF